LPSSLISADGEPYGIEQELLASGQLDSQIRLYTIGVQKGGTQYKQMSFENVVPYRGKVVA
jgi:hypothetical protein